MQRTHAGAAGFVPASGSPSITSPTAHRSTSSRDSIEEILMPRAYYPPYDNAPGPSRGITRPLANVNVQQSNAHQYPSPTDSSPGRGRHVDFGFRNSPEQARSVSIPTPPEFGKNELARHFTITQSTRYPDLHFLLANDLAIPNQFYYDARRAPRDGISREVYESYGALWSMRSRPGHVRIVSRDFPWVIDVEAVQPSDQESGVTCADIWNGLYQELQKPLTDADWTLLTALAALEDEKALQRLDRLTNIATRQDQRGDPISLRRLDWLMQKTLFVGLTKDEDFQVSQKYVLPGKAHIPETWVAEFCERT